MRTEDRRRALLVGYGPPARSSDGSVRALDFVEFLAEEGWSVTIATATPLSDPRDAYELRQAGIPVYDGTTAELETVLAVGDFTVGICTSWQIAELYIPRIRRLSPGTAVLVDCPAFQLARDARRALDASGRAEPLPWLGAEYGSEATGELNAYAAADLVLAASAADASLINALLGDDGLASWLPDAEDVRASRIAVTRRRGIVFPEAEGDPAYAEAAEYLSTEIEPLVDPRVLSRHPVVLGTPSSGTVFGHAWLTVLPLRREPDTRRPLIRSLLAGTPVVASTAAARGLDRGDGVLVADDAWSFASAIERLLADDRLWRRLATRGRSRLKRVHDRAAVKDRFLEAVTLVQTRGGRSRATADGGLERFELRLRRQRNRELVPAIRDVVDASLSADARILVVSEGADELLRLGRARVAHFPPAADEGEAGARPFDSGEAIALLEREIRSGADALVIPSTAADWLDSYPDFADYVREQFSLREDAACTVVDLRRDGAATAPRSELPVRLVAFYLPQFHPIPENDEWWGPGFTEWTNVVRAQPLFPGHYQPRAPAGELGFYDLRIPETREAQARLAADAGIEAFCYYHYWFHGKRLLESPFDAVLASGRPDFRFCLCWTNEPWSRSWDGSLHDILQPQRYSPEDDLAHIKWLLPALADRRALTVDGKPVFLVYRVRHLPEPARTADLWRREVRKAGLPGLYLVSVETGRYAGWNPTAAGFDAAVRFQPDFSKLHSLPQLDVGAPESLGVWDYDEVWTHLAKGDPVAYRRYESVFSAWDNTPRKREHGWVLHNSTPEAYGRWLAQVAEQALAQPPEHRLVFIFAWNEWAEGAYLEPDRLHGRAYLDATKAVVQSLARPVAAAERRALGAS